MMMKKTSTRVRIEFIRWILVVIVTLLAVGLNRLATPDVSSSALWGDSTAQTSPAGNEPALHDVRATGDTMVYLPVVTNWHDPSYVLPFGTTMYGDVNNAQGLQKMQEAGSKWVVTTLYWSQIQPAPAAYYDWSSFDTKAQAAQAANMHVFVLFTGNPYWAAQYPGGPVYSLNSLVEFATLMAERYDCDGVGDAPGSPCVHTWSFYAEPDNGDPNKAAEGKGYWGDNGAGYAAMLAQVAPAIHQANPKAQVLIGGLAYDWFEDEGGYFVRSFFPDTLNALQAYPGGAKAYLDAVAFHFYPISSTRWPTIREKALELRGIMQQYGIGDLPLICPEMGYWSAEEAGSSPTMQANRLVQMFVRGLSVGLQHMSWFTVFDASPDLVAKQPTEEHGLFWGQDLNNPKPSYWAYKAMARELAYAHYSRQLQAANVEGYVFQVSASREKTVLWAKTTSALVSFPGSCLKVTQLLGPTQDIRDGQSGDLDGAVNGQVRIQVTQNVPVYVEVCP